MDQLEDASVIVAVAGMEGALPTVLAGLAAAPIVAVPTSVGYGASLEGVTALLSMLSSCSPGVAVVGIDYGYGAGVRRARIREGRAEPRGHGASARVESSTPRSVSRAR